MGKLIGWHYRSPLFLKLADHTYVQCGTGRQGWRCWGGKKGGSPLRSGEGSTERANAIAERDERAQITCYLVNGVCHQSANRVLLPSGGSVRGARGFWLSVACFNAYGREQPSPCRGTFDEYPLVTGDTDDCAGPSAESDRPLGDAKDGSMEAFLAASLTLNAEDRKEGRSDWKAHFSLMVSHQLGEGFLEQRKAMDLISVRGQFEEERKDVEASIARRSSTVDDVVREHDALVLMFQARCLDVLGDEDFTALFETAADDFVTLADPLALQTFYSDPGSRGLVAG